MEQQGLFNARLRGNTESECRRCPPRSGLPLPFAAGND